VLLEAGGIITTPGGGPLFPLPASAWPDGPLPFLAANPVAHAEVVTAAQELVQTARAHRTSTA
jgi:hypothetical protein